MQHAPCQISGIKKYIVGLIIKTSSDATSLEAERVYLNKLNMILVQVRANRCKFRIGTNVCFVGFEKGMAKELAVLHSGHRGRQ
jgi:hypothetical protein